MPYYDDDGNELNPDLVPMPPRCLAGMKGEIDDELEQILGSLTRLDQAGEKRIHLPRLCTQVPRHTERLIERTPK